MNKVTLNFNEDEKFTFDCLVEKISNAYCAESIEEVVMNAMISCYAQVQADKRFCFIENLYHDMMAGEE